MYWECEERVFGDEEHGASQQFPVVPLASLDFVERDDDSLEEVDVFLSEGDGEARNDGGQDIQEFWGPVELVVLVDEGVEAVSDRFPDHFSPWDKLGVESVQDVLEVFSLLGLLAVEQFQEFPDEFVADERFELLHFGGVIDDELEEELVDRLEMGPGGVCDDFFFFDAHFGDTSFFDDREGTEDIFLNHLHDEVEVGNHEVDDLVLVGQDVTQL